MSDRSQPTTPESPSLPDGYQTQDAECPNLHQLEDLRREHPSEYSILMEALQDDENRRVIAALVNGGGKTYDALDGAVSLSRRRMRDRVYHLKDKGILEVTDTDLAIVHFKSDDIQLLAEDALSFFF